MKCGASLRDGGDYGELFAKVRKFVEDSFDGDKPYLLHFDRTVHWLQQLKPDADEAFLIAAISHDIERASQRGGEGLGNTEKGFLDTDTLRHHQERGAEIVADFLSSIRVDDHVISRVTHLVSKHEVGGDADQNLLKDADSLSFLENNAEMFLAKLHKIGYDKIKQKFDWMYERISNPEALALAQPFYDRMTAQLEAAANRPSPARSQTLRSTGS